MIINDTQRVAFVHIPKCAGTTVRERLLSLDETRGRFTDRVDHLDGHGLIDWVHIPLFALAEHFPAELAKIRDYWSFAIARDPYSRFRSSLSQRLKKYNDQPIQSLSESEILRQSMTVMDELESRSAEDRWLPPDLIHFQRQRDYLLLDGKRLVDAIYPIDDLESLWAELRRRLDLEPGQGRQHANRSVVHRNGLLQTLVPMLKPISRPIGRVMPRPIKSAFRNIVYVPRDSRFENVFARRELDDFISDYYRDDIAIWDEVSRPRQVMPT